MKRKNEEKGRKTKINRHEKKKKMKERMKKDHQNRI